MDELAISGSTAAPNNGTALVMEILPEIRDAILNKYANEKGWLNLAMEQLQTTFSGGDMDTNDKGLAALADLYSGDALASLMADQDMSPEDRRGRLVTCQIATYIAGNELTSVSKVGYDVDAARPAPQTTSGGMFERYKLSRSDSSSSSSPQPRPVPSDGSILVTLCFEDGSIIEARSDALELPGQDYVWPSDDVSLNTDVPIDSLNTKAKNSMWIKIGSIEERNVIQIQMVRKQLNGDVLKGIGLRPLWSAPSHDTSSRQEGDHVILDMYELGSVFVSLPMLSKGQQKLFEEKMAAMPAASKTKKKTTSKTSKTSVAVMEKKNIKVDTESKNDAEESKMDQKKKGPLIQDVTEVDELD